MPYQERDIRYDVAHGYLRQEGVDQASKGGVLHRGPVGMARRHKKEGRDGAEGEGRKRGRGQAAALPRDQGKAGRPTQTRKRSRESPARMTRRTQQREHPVFCFVLFSLQLPVCLWWHDYRRDDFPTLKFGVVMADLTRHLSREEPFALSAAPAKKGGLVVSITESKHLALWW